MADQQKLDALKKVLGFIATNPEYRKRLEEDPLAILDEAKVQLDEATRKGLRGKRFSEFVRAAETKVVEAAMDRELDPDEAATIVGGVSYYAPPYVPVGSVSRTQLTSAWSQLVSQGSVEPFQQMP